MTAFVILACAAILNAQPASDQFEVASVRPAGTPGGRAALEFTPGGGLRAVNVTLKLLIEIAYDIRSEQLSGGPAWTGSDPYTVIAKAPDAGSTAPQLAQQDLTRKRLQALLADRFHVSLKQDGTASGYALTVSKNGHKLTLATTTEGQGIRQAGRWQINAEAAPISTLARVLSAHLGEPVLDRTGLEGRYTFHLNWMPEGGPTSSSPSPLDAASLITAVQDQLGLKLELQKAIAARYTLERAEKPSEN